MDAAAELAQRLALAPFGMDARLEIRALRALREIVVGVERRGCVPAGGCEYGTLKAEAHASRVLRAEANLRKPEPEIPSGGELRSSDGGGCDRVEATDQR